MPFVASLRFARRSLASLASLARVPGVVRPGTFSPGASAPFASAPAFEARGRRSRLSSRLRRSLAFSSAEGIFAEIVGACAGSAAITGWAVHLGCSPLVVSSLSALPFFAQLLQIPGARLTSRFGGRRVAIAFVTASRQAYLPLALVPFLGLSRAGAQSLLVVVTTLAAALGVVANNAWVAWMGDLVPERIRGRYFGRRTARCTLAGAIASIVAGVVLDGARPREHTGAALAALAAVACLAGVVTTVLMAKQHEPARDRAVDDAPPAAAPVLADRRARRYVEYLAAWNFAVGLAGPLFALHMLQTLSMGFVRMALHATATALSRTVAAPIFGRAIDRLGARPVLVACSFAIAAMPLLWVFPRAWWFLPMVGDPILAGAFWSGHGLASFTLPLDLAPPRARARHLGVFAATAGVALGLGAIVGGAIASPLTPVARLPAPLSGMTALQVVFALSALARFAAAGLSLRVVERATVPAHELATEAA